MPVVFFINFLKEMARYMMGLSAQRSLVSVNIYAESVSSALGPTSLAVILCVCYRNDNHC